VRHPLVDRPAGPLGRREVLEGGHEGQLDALAQLVAALGRRVRLQPDRLGHRLAEVVDLVEGGP
jgi:hypothetical protein